MADTARVLVEGNFKLFFNIHANATYAQFLHSLVPFSEPDDQKDTFESMFDGACPLFLPSCVACTSTPPVAGPARARADLFNIFEQGAEAGDGSGREVVVNFGESQLIKAQVDRQLLNDALWAVLSVVLAAIMLRVGSQSTFLTVAGIFMILVRAPLAPLGAVLPSYIQFCATHSRVSSDRD